MYPLIMQYFIGVTVLAMVPELPEIVNGIQFALQNNISLRFEPAVLSYCHVWHFCYKALEISLYTQRVNFAPCITPLFCSLEVGSCIAVQVCMIQIPLLILFNAFYVRQIGQFYLVFVMM